MKDFFTTLIKFFICMKKNAALIYFFVCILTISCNMSDKIYELSNGFVFIFEGGDLNTLVTSGSKINNILNVKRYSESNNFIIVWQGDTTLTTKHQPFNPDSIFNHASKDLYYIIDFKKDSIIGIYNLNELKKQILKKNIKIDWQPKTSSWEKFDAQNKI